MKSNNNRLHHQTFLTFAFDDVFASIRIWSPIFIPRVAMVTSSAAGEAVRDEPLDTVETVETGDRVPDVLKEIIICCHYIQCTYI